jgi:hypothetical protein
MTYEMKILCLSLIFHNSTFIIHTYKPFSFHHNILILTPTKVVK